MEERVKEELMKKARKGRIGCHEARRIAEDLGVAYSEVGKAANELKIKINNCELGCF
jgi:actin-like ATPase involved in cell morphogenesis